MGGYLMIGYVSPVSNRDEAKQLRMLRDQPQNIKTFHQASWIFFILVVGEKIASLRVNFSTTIQSATFLEGKIHGTFAKESGQKMLWRWDDFDDFDMDKIFGTSLKLLKKKLHP